MVIDLPIVRTGRSSLTSQANACRLGTNQVPNSSNKVDVWRLPTCGYVGDLFELFVIDCKSILRRPRLQLEALLLLNTTGEQMTQFR